MASAAEERLKRLTFQQRLFFLQGLVFNEQVHFLAEGPSLYTLVKASQEQIY